MSTSNAASMMDLDYLDEQFNEAPEPETTNIPEGEYVARVESVDFTMTRNDPKPILKQELQILEGEFQGKSLYRNNMMSTPQNLGFLKKDLGTYGIPIHEPNFKLSDFLQNGLAALLDRVVKVTVKKGKPDATGTVRNNVYVNELVSDGNGNTPGDPLSDGQPAGTTASDPTDPWAK